MMDAASDVRRAAKAAWWVVLLQGIAALLLGILLFGQPARTLVVLVLWLGIYWLVDGILYLVGGVTGGATGRGAGSRGWMIFAGIISVVAGLIVLARPLLAGVVTTGFAVYLLAFAIITNGLIQLFAGRVSPESFERERSWVSVLIGILYIVGGLILLFHPAITALTLLSLVSVWAILVGVAYIFLAFRLRSL